MSSTIFVLTSDNAAQTIAERPFTREKPLQELLAREPALLAGDQIDPDSPRQFLLIAREVGIEDRSMGGSRWSLDHLFVDQDARPTLVEVKRGEDTRARREVVGQMLDYAANSTKYWPSGRIRQLFESRCQAEHLEPSAQIAQLLEARGPTDTEVETENSTLAAPLLDAFWNQVDANIAQGEIRIVFLADRLPDELVRIIEYLNGEMRCAEVVGIELRHYQRDDLRFLVPRVVGLSANKRSSRRARTGVTTRWDSESILDRIQKESGAKAAQVAECVMQWCDQRGFMRGFTRAGVGSFVPEVPLGKHKVWPVAISGYGVIKFQLDHLAHRGGGMKSHEARLELIRRLNTIHGVNIGEDRVNGQPSIALSQIARSESMQKLIEILDWTASQIQAVFPRQI